MILGKIKFVSKALCSIGQPKIFCIGRNKTGTTSIGKALEELGFALAPQRPAELLLKHWNQGDFKKIIQFTKYNGQAFQDIPYSLPETFKILDQNFPGSKFILTIRDSDLWYKSLIAFQSKCFGNGGIPRKEDLVNSNYVHQGWAWMANRSIYKTPENDIYNREILISHYEQYNREVISYFHKKKNKLLVIDLNDLQAAEKLSTFLGVNKKLKNIPWLNKR